MKNNVLTEEQANSLKKTEFTSNKSFKVINVYKVEGESFKKFFNYISWSKPMQVIETDHGWFVDATLEIHKATRWRNQQTYDNCSVRYYQGKHKPLWLQKPRDEATDHVEYEANFDLM